jgi:cobalamin biosynthesis protein CobT
MEEDQESEQEDEKEEEEGEEEEEKEEEEKEGEEDEEEGEEEEDDDEEDDEEDELEEEKPDDKPCQQPDFRHPPATEEDWKIWADYLDQLPSLLSRVDDNKLRGQYESDLEIYQSFVREALADEIEGTQPLHKRKRQKVAQMLSWGGATTARLRRLAPSDKKRKR